MKLNAHKTALDAGWTADSVGSSALDGLAEEPHTLGLTVLELDHCNVGGIHCLQPQLSNGTRELIREGGEIVFNRNGAQLWTLPMTSRDECPKSR